MADLGDLAAAIEAERTADGLRRIDPTMPAGVAGESDDCGEIMPRLVDGRCGFCRDGRRPPPERYAAAQARLSDTLQAKETEMPNPKPGTDFQNIGLLARGEMLARIRAHAAEHGLSAGKAALDLMERAMAPAPVVVETARALIDLVDVPLPDLLEEISHRVSQSEALDAANQRAVAAEAKLAAVADLLAGIPGQAS